MCMNAIGDAERRSVSAKTAARIITKADTQCVYLRGITMNEPRCQYPDCGKHWGHYVHHSESPDYDHDFVSPSEPTVGPTCICKTWETRLKDFEGTHRALVDGCPIHGKVRAGAVAPEPPLCPVCKITPMMRDAGGDWECPNRTVGGPHSRFATGEVSEAPEPTSKDCICPTVMEGPNNSLQILPECRWHGRNSIAGL